jgi:hypothetical protein
MPRSRFPISFEGVLLSELSSPERLSSLGSSFGSGRCLSFLVALRELLSLSLVISGIMAVDFSRILADHSISHLFFGSFGFGGWTKFNSSP